MLLSWCHSAVKSSLWPINCNTLNSKEYILQKIWTTSSFFVEIVLSNWKKSLFYSNVVLYDHFGGCSLWCWWTVLHYTFRCFSYFVHPIYTNEDSLSKLATERILCMCVTNGYAPHIDPIDCSTVRLGSCFAVCSAHSFTAGPHMLAHIYWLLHVVE